jgi:hypothetical protein
MKAIHDNPIAKWRKFKPFPLKSRIRHRYALSPFLCNVVLELLTRAIRQEKEKEKFKLSLFAEDKALYSKKKKKTLRYDKNSWQRSTHKHYYLFYIPITHITNLLRKKSGKLTYS